MNSKHRWETNWKREKDSSIGRGGQGHAFLVHALSDPSRTGVLKLQVERKRRNAIARRRMYQEVTTLQVLASAGADVPKVIEHNTEFFDDLDSELYFVMDYVKGETLAKHIESKKRLELVEAVQITKSLLNTIKIAFKEGLGHRDIKPDNLIVHCPNPAAVCVVDFGLAYNNDDNNPVTRADEAFENNFLSLPERRGPEENKRDPRSDLTSICAVLFYCVTGCVPKHLRDSQGRAPHRSPHSTPESWMPAGRQRSLLMSLLDRGLQYEVDQRFQTAAEFENRLNELLSVESNTPSIDLEELAQRHGKILRQNDRKTQLADLRRACNMMPQQMLNHCAKLAQQLQASGRFSIQGGGNPPSFKIDPPQGLEDIKVSHVACLTVAEHDVMYFIVHWAFAAGLDGEIHRLIARGNKPAVFGPVQRVSPGKIIDWELITRFSAVGFEVNVVLDDLNQCIARAIPLITDDICKGNA
jgi:serine/threonine protein kinase